MAMRFSLEDDTVEETHEINVTPFIDVILVLLIIFMVAAPLSTVDVNVDLPASTAQPAPRPDKPLFLTIKADLTLALGDDAVSRENLAGALDAASQNDKEQRVFVRADRKVAYGDVMEMMNVLRAAGYLKIGLVGMEAAPDGPAPPAEGSPPGQRGPLSTPQESPPLEAAPPAGTKP
ncbi:MAG TPA: TonB system transport protein ExbD [Methylocella sp.]|nr:TonB system transport protein ExbD [Methylocella sp.]